jgi:hypothetical protein
VLALGEVVSDSYLFEMHEEVLDSVLTEQSSRTPPENTLLYHPSSPFPPPPQ